MENIKAVLWDADGTLFDATDLHYTTLNLALEIQGVPIISREEHETIFNGLPTTTKLKILSETKGLSVDLHNAIVTEKQRLTLEAIPKTIKPLSNIKNTLWYLKDRGVKNVICSNAQYNTVVEFAKVSEIYHLFDLIIGNEFVVNPKPSPEIFQLASKVLHLDLRDCIIVEDSPKGIQAAKAAEPGYVIEVANPYAVSYKLFEDKL